MNDDVLNHIIKWCRREMSMCQSGFLIHDGGKDSAIETYQAIIKMLMKKRKN